MNTTTIALIRNQQAALVALLSPSTFASRPFRQYSRTDDFETWADDYPTAAFRSFHIQEASSDEEVTQNGDGSEEVVSALAITIAYPRDYQYGSLAENSALDVIRTDKSQITAAIGINGAADYVSGQRVSRFLSRDITETESVRLLTIDFEIIFRRAIP